jgi:hypothetical protein
VLRRDGWTTSNDKKNGRDDVEQKEDIQFRKTKKKIQIQKNAIPCMKSKVIQFRKKIQIQKNAIPCMKSKDIQFRKKTKFRFSKMQSPA